MASPTHTEHQGASTTRKSVDDTTADGVALLPDCKSPDEDGGLSRLTPKPDEVEDIQEEVKMPQQSYYARVLGEVMLVPQTFDFDTYDPEAPVPGTPEPEPYDPETYTAWGRKHFGEAWYELRETMLRERNIYLLPDKVYLKRQRALRVLEHKVEGRLFRPANRVAWMDGENWKRLWSRLSEVLPAVQSPTPTSSVADDSDHDSDGDAHFNEYNTYDPTPSPRETSPDPVFWNAWERLEHERERCYWTEEEYEFERIFLQEDLLDDIRASHENEGGDRQVKQIREELEKVRYEPGTNIESCKYYVLMTEYGFRADGWTQEQLNAKNRAAVAVIRKRENELERKLNRPPKTQEEMISKIRHWETHEISREEQDRLRRMYGFERPPPDPYVFGTPMLKRSPPPSDQEEMDELFCLWSGILGRAEQEELARMYGFGPKHPATARSRQRRTYRKERESRRLAGQLPEFGLLGETESLHDSSSRSLNINMRKTSSPGVRTRQLSKKSTAKGAKPQGISKNRQGGTDPSKRPMRRLRR
ncbi:hypothetical protein B0J18DRAFT_488317 [Chaetomium sp. MPI-SDFR-AT-0129]|nr:hypothetical protein B0J18DRAFT_488317 [Chaetomium sp. MPI-SDFR-AT-0129]